MGMTDFKPFSLAQGGAIGGQAHTFGEGKLFLQICLLMTDCIVRVFALPQRALNGRLMSGLGRVPDGATNARLDRDQLWAGALLAPALLPVGTNVKAKKPFSLPLAFHFLAKAAPFRGRRGFIMSSIPPGRGDLVDAYRHHHTVHDTLASPYDPLLDDSPGLGPHSTADHITGNHPVRGCLFFFFLLCC